MSYEPNQQYPQYPQSYPPPPPDNYGYPASPQPPYQPQSVPLYQQPYQPPVQVVMAPAMAAGPQTSGWAIASLICSLVGLQVLGIIFGFVALNEIKNSGGRTTGEGLAKAGIIIGFIVVGLGLLFLLFYIILIVIVGIGAAATTPNGFLGLLA